MYLFQNQRVQLWKLHSSFFPSPTIIDMFPIPFTWTFEFLSPTSILKPAITPTFKQFYPPPILTKHPVWYSLNANFFIALQGTLYGLHWQYFQSSILFQEIITHGEKHSIRLLPQHPIPFDILKGDLFNHFLMLLYHGSFKLNHLNRDDWIDLKRLCIDWYFPGQTAINLKVLQPSTSTTTTSTKTSHPINSKSTDNSTVKLGHGKKNDNKKFT